MEIMQLWLLGNNSEIDYIIVIIIVSLFDNEFNLSI